MLYALPAPEIPAALETQVAEDNYLSEISQVPGLLPSPSPEQVPLSELMLAQSVVETGNDLGTSVTVEANPNNLGSNQYNIEGGQLSTDGNLFHSFERFGLTQNEIANFVSNPEIRNILSRVVGGEISVIDGLVQVSDGNANL